MAEITWFKFVRTDTNYTQWSVQNSTQVEPFSRLTCERASVQCVIEVFLLAGFYTGEGTIEATGEARMQLGIATSDRRRRLDRNLIMTDDGHRDQDQGRHFRLRRKSRALQVGSGGDDDGSSAVAAEPSPTDITEQLVVPLQVAAGDGNDGPAVAVGADGVEIDEDDLLRYIMDNTNWLKKWEYLLNPDEVIDAVTSAIVYGQEVTNGTSYTVSIIILVLIVLNLVALLMLAFQHHRCKGTRLYLK
jgi:hypothetical protein